MELKMIEFENWFNSEQAQNFEGNLSLLGLAKAIMEVAWNASNEYENDEEMNFETWFNTHQKGSYLNSSICNLAFETMKIAWEAARNH